MKRALIIIGLIIAALALIHFRYILIESHEALPEDVRLGYTTQAPAAVTDACVI